MVPRVGQKIGPYEILGRLGSGGMGLVFSAWDGRLHRDVAIKLLKDEFLNPTMRSRFLGEARAASRLNHPNICTIFDIGEEQDCPYLVMELLKGDTLRGRMQQGAIPVGNIIQVATQVAEALSVAHEHGIVHRDVKPANVVLVDKPGGAFQTKVLDFGLAKVDMEGLDSHSGLTTTGMTVGTVSYMSPEQARGELLDGRSDLFALGVLMYEMATRKLPFDGATSALVFVQLLNHPPESLRGLNASVPRALEQVINTCLQKKRDDRYQNAHDLVLALQKAAQNLDVNEKPTSWLSKFATGLKRESTGQTPAEGVSQISEGGPEPVSPLQMTSDEAFLRPFKPQRRSETDSKHFEPVNEPYTPTESHSVHAGAEAGHEERPINEASEEQPQESVTRRSYLLASESRVSSASVPGLEWLEEPVEAPPHDDAIVEQDEAGSSSLWRVLIGSLLAAAILVISIAVVLSKKKGAAPRAARSVAITTVINHTADSALTDVVSSGLELALEQSPWIGLRAVSAEAVGAVSDVPRAATPEVAMLGHLAAASGAAAFAVGEIHMEGHTYALSLHIYDSASGAAVGECNSAAAGRERLPGAIDGLATSLRAALGETTASINASSLPLSKMATVDMDALIAYQEASKLEAQGSVFGAAEAFERAASIDQQFPQPRLRLAALYHRQHAEVSAATAADQAQTAANASEETKLLAVGMQALISAGDFPRAASSFTQLSSKFPLSEQGFTMLSETQRMQGDFAGALTNAQQAARLDPSSSDAITEMQLAMLALDRPEEALKLKRQNADSEAAVTNPELLARFVRGDAVNPAMFASLRSEEDMSAQMTEAALLDASGQLAAGLMKWRTVAQRALSNQSFTSTSSFALSHAALNRALAGDCSTASDLTREMSAYAAGAETMFTLGLSSALCGNTNDARSQLASITATYRQSSRVRGFYSSDLNAMLQWKSGALADGLATLQSAAQYDLISFNQYLEAQIYLAQKQPQPATVTLQVSLRHPGALVQVNPQLLPMTQLTLARAFASNGDAANAGRAYTQVANILRGADVGNPLLLEAQAVAAR